MKLQTKLIALIIILVFMSGGLFAYFSHNIIQHALEENLIEKGSLLSRTLSELISDDVLEGNVLHANQELVQIVHRNEDVEYAFITDFNGNIFTHSFEKGFPIELIKNFNDRPNTNNDKTLKFLFGTIPVINIARPLINGMDAQVTVGLNESGLLRHMKTLYNRVIYITLGIASIGVILGVFISRFLTQPIIDITESLKAFGTGSEDNQLTFTGQSKEGDILIQSFNQMIIERKRLEDEKEQLEKELRFSLKLQAVGQLTGGIAHEFNNTLTAIIGYGNILKIKLGDNNELTHYANQILSTSERAAGIVSKLLAFSRKHIIHPRTANINSLINDAAHSIELDVGDDISLKLMLCSNDLTALVDTEQIRQILHIIASNARDAMPDGGTITIKTDQISLHDEQTKSYGYGAPGNYAQISIHDTGTGIDQNILHKIFEPFFTTKEMTKGMGLGLAMAYGIVKNHKGLIHAESEPGKGTTIEVRLPIIDAVEPVRKS